MTAEARVAEEREGAMAAAATVAKVTVEATEEATVAEVTVEAKGVVARVEARVAVATTK